MAFPMSALFIRHLLNMWGQIISVKVDVNPAVDPCCMLCCVLQASIQWVCVVIGLCCSMFCCVLQALQFQITTTERCAQNEVLTRLALRLGLFYL